MDVSINHGVPQGSALSPVLYLIFTHDLPPTSKVFRSIFADDLKYFVARPNLSIIITNLQQSMDYLAVYANQWRIRLNAGKTSKNFVPALDPIYSRLAHHTTRQDYPLCHFRQVSWHHFRHHVILHQTLPCYHQPCSSPQSLRKQCSAARLYPQPHPIHCRTITTNTKRNTETIINLLFSSGTLAATLTNYEIEKK